ncbi:Membrane protein involved in the export of O-antigen and teichoic acid [Micromonospora citrea]|uniref:Membrane protein involved in the export of O-antigen and teichoic acid n=1 Tax=Micromonospora citrea TaxID=47855 RepID=A0A1C6U3B4_9ACTN|nr:oligosaccharide flippase family protein [Micromonospora citrea]SCL48398.1 Membrane protein involved in the export of O-antigen and teichoic acid [Micromonospora citrea]
MHPTVTESADARAPLADPAVADRGRDRRLVAGIATTVGSRAVGAIVPLLLLPLTQRYLGVELFGLWQAVTALTAMAAFADLGLGNGLMTKLADAHARGDAVQARRYVSTAYLTLAGAAGAACAALWLGALVTPWVAVFNLPSAELVPTARTMTLVCLTVFILNVPMSLVVRVQYGVQQVACANSWQLAGSLLCLPLTLVAVALDAGPVPLVAAAVSGPLLGNLVNSLWLYIRRMPELAPSPRYVEASAARVLLKLGGMFLLLTAVLTVATNTDPLIVAQTRGLAEVAVFAVAARLFAQLGLLMSMMTTALWPAYGEALAHGRVDWVRRLTGRMTLIAVAAVGLPSVVVALVGGEPLAALMGMAQAPDRWLLAGLGAWWMVLAVASPWFMVQNAAGVVRPQLAGWTAYLALAVPLKGWGAGALGTAAVPWLGAAVGLVTVVPAALLGYRQVVTRARPAAHGQRVTA